MPRGDSYTGLTKTIQEEGSPRSTRSRGVLTVLTGAMAGRVLSLDDDEAPTFGRSDDCTYRFDDPSLSRVHGTILRARGEYLFQDAGSTNGSFLNGERVSGRASLHDGDRIQLGKQTILRFSLVNEEEERALRHVYEAAVRDQLTGVFNRKAFDQRFDAELGHAARSGGELSIVLVDLDFFKRVNDTHGHLGGDAALKVASGVLASGASPTDFVARYGGEEFVILCRGRDARSALELAEWYRAGIEAASCAYEGRFIPITASAGVASLACCGPTRDRETLVATADRRLYQAKQGGRNRVVGP
jgi:two-component system, cell cycle response regulator